MEKFSNKPDYNFSDVDNFFSNKIVTLTVPREEFLTIIKNQDPSLSDEDILQAKGYNFDYDGKIIILVREGAFPQKYLPYLETHEKWEAYVARKEGYNLYEKALSEFEKKSSGSQDEFFKQLGVYNYEFRHEFAIYKEYLQARQEGNLEEYHQWFMELREKELLKASDNLKKMLKNDTEIRQSIYQKILTGSKHYFLRKD